MEYKLIETGNILKHLGIGDIPTNIETFYDLSYQLSTFIYEYRIKHHFTQKAFSELLGVKQPMVSKLESGNYNISLQSICDVMAKLDAKVELSFRPNHEGMESKLGYLEMESNELTEISNAKIRELGVAI